MLTQAKKNKGKRRNKNNHDKRKTGEASPNLSTDSAQVIEPAKWASDRTLAARQMGQWSVSQRHG